MAGETERIARAAEPLLAWYGKNKRDLPWRGTRDPYRIWVSEIMLQQTRTAAAAPYYRRWMEVLPTVEDLANADGETVLKLWQGLGYYSRARNLHRAAKEIAALGRFPSSREELKKLPGVGEYTAGAVASIAFGERTGAVDGNALRIIARLTAFEGNVTDEGARRTVRGWVDAAVPADRPGEFNQALMDLGAAVCLPGVSANCGLCPIGGLCEAKRLGAQSRLPVRGRRAPRRVEELTVYLLVKGDTVAVRKRPESGLLAGLWEFPHAPGLLDERRAAGPLEAWGLAPAEWRERLRAKHEFTHVEWRMTGYLVTVRGEGPQFTWADRAALETLAVPSAFGKFLAAVSGYFDSEGL